MAKVHKGGITGWFGRLLGGLVKLVLALAVLFAGLYFVAQSALGDLDKAMAEDPNRAEVSPPWLPWYKSAPLFVVAQVLPLHQPGADLVKPGRIFKDCPDCPEMVQIPAGYFLLGTPLFEEGRYTHMFLRKPLYRQLKFAEREGPRWLARIPRTLAFSRYEITVAHWDAAQNDTDWQAVTGRPPRHPDMGPDYGPDRPVTRIERADAEAYAAYISARTGHTYRLATDAEWEYAARAGTVTRFPWGDEPGQEHAACVGCSARFTEGIPGPVGQYPPNGFGLYDMIGNGIEWVQDCFEPYHAPVKRDGSAHVYDDCEFGVFRGGGAGVEPWQTRSGVRVGPHPYNGDPGSVIRLVREMDG